MVLVMCPGPGRPRGTRHPYSSNKKMVAKRGRRQNKISRKCPHVPSSWSFHTSAHFGWPNFLSWCWEGHSPACCKQTRFVFVIYSVMHDGRISVTLNIGGDSLLSIAPLHFAHFVAALNAPSLESIEMAPSFLSDNPRSEIDECIANSDLFLKIHWHVSEIVCSFESLTVEQIQKIIHDLVVRQITKHQCCAVISFIHQSKPRMCGRAIRPAHSRQ